MRSISFRLTIWYALAATITAGIFLLIGRYALEGSYIAGIDDLNDKEFEEIAPRIRKSDATEKDVIDSIVHHTEIDASLFFFQVGHSDYITFFTSSNMAGHLMPVAVHGKARSTVFDDELGLMRVSEFKVNGFDVHIATSLQGWETLNAKLIRVAGLILAAVFVTSLGVGYLLSRVALNPIANIERTANRIGAQNLSERIEVPTTGDEIAKLTQFLNEMFDRLEAAFRQVQRFAADASHELKTPLSLVRLRSEELLRSESNLSENGRSELQQQLNEVEKLGLVIDDLLILSKSEAGALKLNLSERPTNVFLADFAEDAKVLCEDVGVTFQFEDKSNCTVCFDEVWIRHTLFNLLSNSLKFVSSGTDIHLVSRDDGQYWYLIFEDEGPGVSEGKLSKIFDRFYSEDLVGVHATGSGLGLALCRSIVTQHRGTITAQNRKNHTGLRIEIRLPLSCSDD